MHDVKLLYSKTGIMVLLVPWPKVIVIIMEQCISELRNWMSRNMLKLNDDKTEFIILGTDASLKKVKIESIKVGNHEIKRVESVRKYWCNVLIKG